MGAHTREADCTTWHDLHRPFVGRIVFALRSHRGYLGLPALQEDDVGTDPGYLSGLQELVSDFCWENADGPFGSFIHSRQVAGRPVSLSSLRSNPPALGKDTRFSRRFDRPDHSFAIASTVSTVPTAPTLNVATLTVALKSIAAAVYLWESRRISMIKARPLCCRDVLDSDWRSKSHATVSD